MEKILVKLKKIIPKKLFKAIQPAYHFLLAFTAAMICGFPSERLVVIGVTGTTGKTTSVYLIAKMLQSAGYKVGFTSTAMFANGRKEWMNDKKMTMVGRFFTQKMLRDMADNGCQIAIVETTSEGVSQYRHRFINYDMLVFTGLYPEHIESHGSFEKYKQAKGKLFDHLRRCQVKYTDEQCRVVLGVSDLKKTELNRIKKTIIANGDDQYAEYFLNFIADKKYAFGTDTGWKLEDSDSVEKIMASNIVVSGQGTSFLVADTAIQLQLLGAFNVTNAMTAVCSGLALGLNMEQVKTGLEAVKGVAGRLERIDEGQDYVVIVDYAFEPNAVAKLYETIAHIPHERVIHVLGSTGGGRDIVRRPKLGELAGQNADIVIITNEDPYDDAPDIIIDQVALGAEKAGKKVDQNLFKILDRREAIKLALSQAKPGDVVLITGKGSEQAICVADGEKIPWDDRAVVRGLLYELKESGKKVVENQER